MTRPAVLAVLAVLAVMAVLLGGVYGRQLWNVVFTERVEEVHGGVREVGSRIRWGTHKGEYHGLYTNYHVDSPYIDAQGSYDTGREIGVWTSWDERGLLEVQLLFRDGDLIEERYGPPWFADVADLPASEGVFAQNYVGTRVVRVRGLFRNRRRDGTWTTYNRDGSIYTQEHWEHGKLHSTRTEPPWN